MTGGVGHCSNSLMQVQNLVIRIHLNKVSTLSTYALITFYVCVSSGFVSDGVNNEPPLTDKRTHKRVTVKQFL